MMAHATIVATLVTAFLFQSGHAFFTPLTRPSALGHSNLWSQFQQGFDQLERIATQEAERFDGAFHSSFGHLDKDVEDADFGSSEVEPISSPAGFFNLFGGPGGVMSQQHWWKGPNVCVEREEVDESQHKNDTADGDDDDDDAGMFGSYQFSTCQQTEYKYVCTTKIRNHGIRKTFVVKYQCCYGFQRLPGKPGCTKVDLKSMMQTASDLHASDFVQLIKTAGLEEKLSADNLTLFAPSNDAVRDFTDSLQEANQVEFYVPPATARRRRSTDGTSMREVVLGHMVPGYVDISDVVDEQILFSDNNKSPVRVNVYPGRIVTVNCARVTAANNYATNGIVHIVDRVIRPVSKSLGELVTQDKELTTLATMFKKSNMMDLLKKPGHVTLFAPTDSAFEKLDSSTRDRLMAGEACVGTVLRHHLVPHSICTAAITQHGIVPNLAGDTLKLERTADDGILSVSGAKLKVRDVLATNGIIHIIEDVIMPDSARPVSHVLKNHNLTTFLSLLTEAGLADSLDSMSNVTLFAPSDSALADPRSLQVLQEAQANPDRLRDLLLYHTAGPSVAACDLSNNQLLKSGVADKNLRINLYATLPFLPGTVSRATVQCARLSDLDLKACRGMVHEVDRLLVPPKGSVLELIEKNENYTILREVLKDTEVEADLKESGPFTFLAPDNSAFENLEKTELEKLKGDKHLASSVLKLHVLPDALCCSGVGANTWPFTNRVETLAGQSIPIRRDHEGHIHMGSTTVHSCDNMATNGIVHSVNRVMVPHSNRRSGLQKFGNPNIEVFLYGL